MLNTHFSPWPSFTLEEAKAVEQVLLSNKVNYWTGDEGRLFEQEFAMASGCEYAIAVSNGTVALELALRGLGIGPGDEVIVTSRTFMASASCVVAVGATPVFADVDRDSQNITLATVAAKITPAHKGHHCGSPGGVALRHGRPHGAGAQRYRCGRGLCTGSRGAPSRPLCRVHSESWLLVLLSGQDPDDRW